MSRFRKFLCGAAVAGPMAVAAAANAQTSESLTIPTNMDPIGLAQSGLASMGIYIGGMLLLVVALGFVSGIFRYLRRKAGGFASGGGRS